KSHRSPGSRLGARGPQNPSTDLGSNRGIRERLDERPRSKNATDRMPPPQECLRADDRFVAEPDLRLEIELELVLGESASELEIETAPRLRLRAKHGQEEA